MWVIKPDKINFKEALKAAINFKLFSRSAMGESGEKYQLLLREKS